MLAQQIVAMAALDTWDVDELFALVRRAAPFADLSRRMFEGVLDMLSGRYPSDEFAELRPRVTWDRVQRRRRRPRGREARRDRQRRHDSRSRPLRRLPRRRRSARCASASSTRRWSSRPQVGETFTLGASTWRVEEITHDRVLVSPAPGEPGKMPFWHGDQAGRPVELGFAIGKLVRELRGDAASRRRRSAGARMHDLDATAAENLLRYLDDQAAAGAVPDDRTIVIERCLDELGDWRVCLLSPLGSRIHAPWAMAVDGADPQPHRASTSR